MRRWFVSDAGRWFCIGIVASSIFGNSVRGWGDPLIMTVCLVLLVLLLVQLTSALHGERRPWLRTMRIAEKPDGQVVIEDQLAAAESRWVPAGK